MNDVVFQVSDLEKNYPGFRLGQLDLELEAGAIMGLIGPNGAGKSTLIRILTGLIRADQGQVSVLGYRMPEEERRAKGEIGFVSEDMRLYGGATLGWHMRWLRSIVPHWDGPYANELIDRFRLDPDKKLKRLSHGQRVKAALLLAMARRPRLLVLDEPTTGLDPVVRREVLGELLAVIRDENRSVVFSSHNTADVEQVSDYIAFIDEGRILESMDKESLLEKWRRLHVRFGSSTPSVEALPVCEIERDGQLGVLTTGSFSEELHHRIHARGDEVLEVERMTLEEIFLQRIEMGRKGVAA